MNEFEKRNENDDIEDFVQIRHQRLCVCEEDERWERERFLHSCYVWVYAMLETIQEFSYYVCRRVLVNWRFFWIQIELLKSSPVTAKITFRMMWWLRTYQRRFSLSHESAHHHGECLFVNWLLDLLLPPTHTRRRVYDNDGWWINNSSRRRFLFLSFCPSAVCGGFYFLVSQSQSEWEAHRPQKSLRNV